MTLGRVDPYLLPATSKSLMALTSSGWQFILSFKCIPENTWVLLPYPLHGRNGGHLPRVQWNLRSPTTWPGDSHTVIMFSGWKQSSSSELLGVLMREASPLRLFSVSLICVYPDYGGDGTIYSPAFKT